LGRIGCFLNGCCFGKTCDLPWAVIFPPNSAAGYHMGEIALHPTQLYSSLYAFLIFLLLMYLDKQEYFDGFIFSMFMILYGIARFSIDFFRFYETQMFLIDGIVFNQVVSFFMIISGVILLFINRKRAREKLTNS